MGSINSRLAITFRGDHNANIYPYVSQKAEKLFYILHIKSFGVMFCIHSDTE